MQRVNYSQDRLKNFELKALLRAINEGTKADDDERVTFTNYSFGEYFFLLAEAFEFPDSLTPGEGRRAVRTSCVAIRKTDTEITERGLLQEVRTRVSAMLNEAPATYTMWSSSVYDG